MDLIEEIKLADNLHYALTGIVEHELGAIATVSTAICHEIIVHHFRDMERLYKDHQRLLHPSKHIAYLAFWIRKLKPIDSAYPKSAVEQAMENGAIKPRDEVVDVNERAAVFYALRLLDSYIREGGIKAHGNLTPADFADKTAEIARAYFDDEVTREPELGRRFEALVYDMRYRTFGPHHFVYIFNHLLHEACLTE